MDAAIAGMSRGAAVRRGYNFLDGDGAFPRLNDCAVANVYTVQHQAGCTNALRIDPRLPLAAQLHTAALNGGSGSDGSTPKE
jgi:hypothetical protein